MAQEETMEDWEENMRVELSYIDVPKKYHAGVIGSIKSLLSSQRTQTIEDIKKKVGNGWYGKSSNGMVDIHVIGISTLYEILDSLK